MPTKHERIYVPISPELSEALTRFNEQTGIAKSQILGQIVSESAPIINSMTEAFRLARKSPSQAADLMRNEVVNTQVKLAQTTLDLSVKPKKKKLRKSPSR